MVTKQTGATPFGRVGISSELLLQIGGGFTRALLVNERVARVGSDAYPANSGPREKHAS